MPSWNTYRLTWVSLTLDEEYLFTATLPDLQRGIAPLGPPAPAQPWLLGRGVGPPGLHPWPWAWVAPPCSRPWPQVWGSSSGMLPLTLDTGISSWPLPLASDLGSSSRPFLRHCSLALSAAAPDLGRGVTPLGRCPSGMGSSQLLSLTSDMG